MTITSRRRSAPVARDRRKTNKAEAVLWMSGELSRQILLGSQVGIVAVDRKFNVLVWNRLMETLTGMPRERVLGRYAFELFPLARRQGIDHLLKRAFAGEFIQGVDFPFEVPQTGKSGWFTICFGPLHDERAEITGALSTVYDSTDRKRSEAALRASSELNKQIIESAGEGIIVYDRQLRYKVWNPYMERVSGLPAREVLGKHSVELFPFLREQGIYPLIQKALAGEAVTTDVRRYFFPGTKKTGWSEARLDPLRDGSGEIVGVIGTVRDVTAAKEREDHLRQLSSRLLQVQDEARRNVARDLHDSCAQTLLAISLNLAQLSESGGALSDKGRRLLSESRKMVKACTKEIRSLSYLLHPPLLDELGLGSAIEEYARGFGKRSGIRMDVQISSGVGRLPQEVETAIFRIVQESLGNIQRHSGSPTATIRLTEESSLLSLEVADEGRGIPSEIRKGRQAGSTELGVGIVGMRGRMTQLGGRLEIHSGRRGTTVRAELPLQMATKFPAHRETYNDDSHLDRG